MTLLLECILICLLMWGICYLNTGSDEKNMKSLRSYPLELQNLMKDHQVKESRKMSVFVSNVVMFGVIELIFGYFMKTDVFVHNFVALLILGQVLNVFDLVVIDLMWWRNSPRIRFKDFPDPQLYKNPQQHIDSFKRALIMFTVVALIDGLILTLL